MKYLLAALIFIILGCSSSQKIAQRKAAKDDIARKERIQLLKEARNAYPCDTITRYYTDTLEKVLPGDTTVINDTVFIRLPGKNITHTKIQTIIDRIEVEKLTMQLESIQYAAQLQAEENAEQDKEIDRLTEANTALKKRNMQLWIGFVWIGAALVLWILLRIKSIL